MYTQNPENTDMFSMGATKRYPQWWETPISSCGLSAASKIGCLEPRASCPSSEELANATTEILPYCLAGS